MKIPRWKNRDIWKKERASAASVALGTVPLAVRFSASRHSLPFFYDALLGFAGSTHSNGNGLWRHSSFFCNGIF